jgi:hypothetical protein
MTGERYFVTVLDDGVAIGPVVIVAESAPEAERQASAIASLFPGRAVELATADMGEAGTPATSRG